jgi:hypothetical protein
MLRAMLEGVVIGDHATPKASPPHAHPATIPIPIPALACASLGAVALQIFGPPESSERNQLLS